VDELEGMDVDVDLRTNLAYSNGQSFEPPAVSTGFILLELSKGRADLNIASSFQTHTGEQERGSMAVAAVDDVDIKPHLSQLFHLDEKEENSREMAESYSEDPWKLEGATYYP
jgi:hypothetical protein